MPKYFDIINNTAASIIDHFHINQKEIISFLLHLQATIKYFEETDFYVVDFKEFLNLLQTEFSSKYSLQSVIPIKII